MFSWSHCSNTSLHLAQFISPAHYDTISVLYTLDPHDEDPPRPPPQSPQRPATQPHNPQAPYSPTPPPSYCSVEETDSETLFSYPFSLPSHFHTN